MPIERTPAERRELAVRLRRQGLTFRQIGEILGVRQARAYQIWKTALWWEQHQPDWAFGLDLRVINHLQNLGLHSREQVLDAWKSGKISARTGSRGFGPKSHVKLAKWLGLEP